MSNAREVLRRISCSALGVSGALALALAATPQRAVAEEQPSALADVQAAAAEAVSEGTEAPAEAKAASPESSLSEEDASSEKEASSAKQEEASGIVAEAPQAPTSEALPDPAASALAEMVGEAPAEGAPAADAADVTDDSTTVPASSAATFTVEILGTTSGKLEGEAVYGVPLAAGVRRSDDPDAYVMDFTGYDFAWTDTLDGKNLDIWGQANNIVYVNPVSGSVVTVTVTAPDGTVQTASVTLGYEKAEAGDVRYYRWSDGSVDLRCEDGVSAPWDIDVSYDGGKSWQTLTCYGFSLSLPADKVKIGLVKARYPENDYYLEGPITSIVNLGSPSKGDSFTVSSVWTDGATGDEAVADISFTVDLNYSVNPPTDYDRTVTEVTAANGTVWTCTPVGYRSWVYTTTADLSAANGWRATVQIPDELGDESYAYPADFTVKEKDPAYSLVLRGSIADGIVLVHAPSEETFDIPVTATMPEGSAAPSAKAVLTRNGESVAILDLVGTSDGSGSFAGQLRYAPDGTRYQYGVYAIGAEGWDVTVSGSADEGFSLAFAPKRAEAVPDLPVSADAAGRAEDTLTVSAAAETVSATAAGVTKAGRGASALPETGDMSGIVSVASLAASGIAVLAGAFSLLRRHGSR